MMKVKRRIRKPLQNNADHVLRYMVDKNAPVTPTEVGMLVLGSNYNNASSKACRILKVLEQEKKIQRVGRGKYIARKAEK